MSELKPLTALGASTPRSDLHGGVTLTENTGTALASFAARSGSEAKAASTLEGFVGAKPPLPGLSSTGGTIGALWIGPEQWMVTAPHDTHEDLAAQLKAKAGDAASVTEQNDAWCRLDLEGPDLADVFERLCPVNLRAQTGGEATRTTIEHLGCILVCHGAQSASVLGPRSAAGSLHHALLTALRSAL
ncbi:MAG: sarcosine oxidase subunit gamma [Pseudomonadota bacterium]